MKRKLTIGIQLIDEPGWMGGTLYVRNLVICLGQLPEQERPYIRLFGAPEVVSSFLKEWGHLPFFVAGTDDSLSTRFSRFFGFRHKEHAVDVIYPGFGPPMPGTVTVRWIPDFQHRYFPELFSADEIAARDHSIGEIAAESGIVVLSSEVAENDYRLFYPNHRAVPHVWHFCSIIDTMSAPSIETIKKYDLPDKYLYLPNQFWAHKNHITVFKALALLRKKYDMIIPLVCTGMMQDRRNEAHVSGLLSLIESHDMKSQVHMLGLIDRNDQIEIFRHAAAVVQPSLFEGWSTVVEDVRAVGRPIFLSDIPVHREQSPEKGFFFSPASHNELADLLRINWPILPAGPDLSAEKSARELLNVRILESARSFYKITREAVIACKKTA